MSSRPATADVPPEDLVTFEDAAAMSERSARTIRRWASAGHLRRWDGPTPEGGGSPLALVSKRELLAYLAMSGQQPKGAPAKPAPVDVVTDDHPDEGGPGHTADDPSTAVRVAVLEGRLAVAELRAELATATAERDALRGRLENLEAMHGRELSTLRDALETARDDGAAWRARAVGLEAELRQLQRERGLPWWRRLLGGPVSPEPPELPGWSVEQLPPEAK